MDVVLDSLAGEFVDASLELLPRGGRFLEMGKTDVRDSEEIAGNHPGVDYRAFDVMEVDTERIQEILVELMELFERGVLKPLPINAWDVRRAPEAFRFMSQARHVGKNVLSLPTPLDPQGTVLITGGTGMLGSLVAKHLAVEHGSRHLLLVSQRGHRADGVAELVVELAELGCEAHVSACDVADPDALRTLLGSISEERPLTAIIHAAGVLDDGVIGSLTPDRVDRVLRPKLDAAWYLHKMTAHLDLSAFVLFSSAAGVIGNAGQASYAAANVFLDALAAHRRSMGQAAISMAWGLWAQASKMTDELEGVDLARMRRQGVAALSSERALELFDIALEDSKALVLPMRLDVGALRAQARVGLDLPLLRGVFRAPLQRMHDGSLARRLASLPEGERENVVLEVVRAESAVVLGHASPVEIAPQRTFKDIGFDSLTVIELRNRLSAAIGVRLPDTLAFDYPTPAAVAGYVLAMAAGVRVGLDTSVVAELDNLESLLEIGAEDEKRMVTVRLREILAKLDETKRAEASAAVDEQIRSASAEQVVEFIEREFKPNRHR